MNAFSKIDMGEVTRLTQSGKLAEAMALLQGHPASSIAGGSPGSVVPRLTQGIKRPSSPSATIDMIAPPPPMAAKAVGMSRAAPPARPEWTPTAAKISG